MFKLSIVDTHRRRMLVLEGMLAQPWTGEVESAWKSAGENLHGRKLVIDLKDVLGISREGEETLLKLMEAGAKFSCRGVLMKHVLKELSRKCGCTPGLFVAVSHSKKSAVIKIKGSEQEK